MDEPTAEGRLLFDPNSLSQDGTVALNDWYSQRRRALAGLRHQRQRLRLADLARAQRGQRRGPARFDRMEQVLRRSLAAGRRWLLLCPLRTPRSPGKISSAPITTRSCTSTAWASPRRMTSWSMHRPDQKEWGFAPQVSDDGRYLVHHRLAGHRYPQPPVLPGSGRRRQQWSS